MTWEFNKTCVKTRLFGLENFLTCLWWKSQKVGSQKKCGSKIITSPITPWVQNMLSQICSGIKIILRSKRNLRSDKILKIMGQKDVGFKDLGPKNVGSKNQLVQKKNLDSKSFGVHKKIWSQNYFLSKKRRMLALKTKSLSPERRILGSKIGSEKFVPKTCGPEKNRLLGQVSLDG